MKYLQSLYQSKDHDSFELPHVILSFVISYVPSVMLSSQFGEGGCTRFSSNFERFFEFCFLKSSYNSEDLV